MFKKLILLAASFLLIPCAFAMGEAPQPMFDGFYVGLGAGYASLLSDTNVRNDVSYRSQQIEPPLGGLTLHTGAAEGGFDLFGGYGRVISHNVYLGGELLGRWTPFNGGKKQTGYAYIDKDYYQTTAGALSSLGSLGALVKLGWVPVNNVMLYLTGGLNYTYFKAGKTTLVFLDIPISGKSFNFWRFGVTPGLGVAFALWQNWVVSLQTAWEFYGRYTHTDNFPVNNGDGINMRTSVKPFIHYTNLRVAYRIPA